MRNWENKSTAYWKAVDFEVAEGIESVRSDSERKKRRQQEYDRLFPDGKAWKRAHAYARKAGIRNVLAVKSVFDMEDALDERYPPFDLAAVKVAEEILQSIHGKRDLENGNRGGWDSEGVWGLDVYAIGKAWRVSGCKDTPKFRLIIRCLARLDRQPPGWFNVVKSGDSLQFCRDIFVGLSWITKNGNSMLAATAFSRKAVAALGRISVEARRAAMSGVDLRTFTQNNPVRVRDLNWKAVATLQALRKSEVDSERVWLALNSVSAAGGKVWEYAGKLTPQYPDISPNQARALVLGCSPVELSGGALTSAQAHRWLQDGGYTGNIIPMILDGVNGVEPSIIKSAEVAKWLANLAKSPKRWAAVFTKRTYIVPNGTIEYDLVGLLSQIKTEDVLTISDSVSDVVDRCLSRIKEADLRSAMEEVIPFAEEMPEWASRLPEGVTLLWTPRELVSEGKAMNHCVGNYVGMAREQQCFILHIETSIGSSTASLSRELKVQQHYKADNLPPFEQNESLLKRTLDLLLKTT